MSSRCMCHCCGVRLSSNAENTECGRGNILLQCKAATFACTLPVSFVEFSFCVTLILLDIPSIFHFGSSS